MLTVSHAILHAFDFDTGTKVLSSLELDLSERSTRSYVQRHLRRASTTAEARHGSFEDGSEFAERVRGYFAGADFVELSQEVALYFWEQLRMSEDPGQCDLLVADFEDTGDLSQRAAATGTAMGDALADAAADAAFEAPPQRKFAALLLPRRQVFVHDLRTVAGEDANEVVRTDAILPNPSQKVDSFLVVDDGTLSITFADKPRNVAGQPTQIIPEGLLKCSSQASSHEVIAMVSAIVEDVAEEHGLQPAVAVSRAKAYVAENAQMHERVSPREVGEHVFADAPEVRESFERELETQDLPMEAPVKRGVANRIAKRHRVRTDTGIEVVFPSEYAARPDLIDFVNEADGSVTISIRGVNRIENK